MLIATKIFELLQQNIDSLDIPKIFKKVLKKLKELIFKQQKNAEKEIHSSSQETLFVEGESRERAAVAAAAARAQAATAAPPAAAAVATVAPVARPVAKRRRGRPRRQVAGVKNVERRVRNKQFKIKCLLAQPKNIEVKRRGVVLRRMVARRKPIFSAEVRRAYY